MEDALLVWRCKQRDPDALGRIYRKYRDYLLILAVALSHNVNLAEDAVHDTFVSFAENIDSFKLTGSLKAYLATCVANQVRDLNRRQQRSAARIDGNCPAPQDTQTPAGTVICNEELQLLNSAMTQLPDEQREVIALHIYGKMRFKAIAQSLGLSVNTVKGRYRYGLNKLRSILDTEGHGRILLKNKKTTFSL